VIFEGENPAQDDSGGTELRVLIGYDVGYLVEGAGKAGLWPAADVRSRHEVLSTRTTPEAFLARKESLTSCLTYGMVYMKGGNQ